LTGVVTSYLTFVLFIEVFAQVVKLRALITTTVNLNRKLGYLRSQKKIKIFQRHVLSKAFCHSSNVRMRTNVFHEEAITDHKVEEY